MEKLIITAAISGAEVTKAMNPAVPYTTAEFVREATAAYDAGASVITCMCAGTTARQRRTRRGLRKSSTLSAGSVPT